MFKKIFAQLILYILFQKAFKRYTTLGIIDIT